MLRKGEGIPKDPVRARAMFKQLGDGGDLAGQFEYAQMLLEGEGGPKDLRTATQLHFMGHSAGYDEASCDYAYILINGLNGPPDITQGINIYKQAATRGAAAAQVNLGIMYHKGNMVPGDPAQAAHYFAMAARQRDPAGEAYWGTYLWRGLGGLAQNPTEARRLFKHAADKGDKTAQNHLGVMCEAGEGGPVNVDEALHYHQLAAENGIARALVRYARLAWILGDPEAMALGRQYLQRCRREAPDTPDLSVAEREYGT
jgi:TPR repeat protein